MKAKKKAEKKVTAKKAIEKDTYGFAKGSKSHQAVALLASGKSTLKDARKKFKTLAFGYLVRDLEKRGFSLKEDSNALCSIVAKGRARG